ncbi:MAG: ribbon-helix-helix domain-containing protein [Thermoproteota archaeon]|jgi:Predicted transcriptional regulators containing the CopG/Arc/MetJ DNA-binding domain
MRIISVKLPEKYVEKIDELIKEGRFTNRSELIRYALLDLFRKEEENKNEIKGKVLIGP